MKLNLAKLATLGTSVSVPSYNRGDITPGIVHVGVGNFFRGHQAVYMDDLFNKDLDKGWGIVGAGVSNGAKNVRAAMEDQDWLTTVVARDGESEEAKVIGSIIDFVPVDLETYGPLRQALLDPNIKLVTTTVTEGGYYQDESGKFDEKNPKIIADAENPENPKTIYGIFIEALKKRREAGLDPFTILCCDNVIHGGDVVKKGVLGLCKLMKEDPEFIEYIEQNVGFPNGMVDRIVPKTTNKERFYLKDKYGFEDEWPIFCEPFYQWVLEDDFKQGRPAWEKVGVNFVDDVGPYELKKLRILNGGHASLCYPAALLGLQYVHEAMEHPVIGKFLDCLERNEIIPAVPPVPDVDLTEYWETIQNRFLNPTICDRIDRNCAQGSDRQCKFIIPTAADAVKLGGKVDGLALVSAMWCRYCQGTTESGIVLPPNDTIWDTLKETALAAKEDPTKWLAMHDIYGDLGEEPVFVEAFSSALKLVNEKGCERAMKAFIEKNEAVNGSKDAVLAAVAEKASS